MAILDIFVNEKKVSQTIETLQGKKNNLKNIIEEEIKSVFKKRFPEKSYEELAGLYGSDINKMREFLYNKYSEDIALKIRQLVLLKQEI